MSKTIFRNLFNDPNRIIVTAHRGFSGMFPENTLLAFNEAVKLGVDCIEFDLRATKDLVPIVLHDDTLDRTTDGIGSPGKYTLQEIKRLNASYFKGTYAGDWERLDKPLYPKIQIPTFEEVLQTIPENICLNIQVYEATPPEFLNKICELYDKYDIYKRGYLSMETFKEADTVRRINEKIDICILEGQCEMDEKNLLDLQDWGCDIIQPWREQVSPDLCRLIQKMGFHANMFYSNTDADNRKFIGYGMRGILSDFPNLLQETINDMGLIHGGKTDQCPMGE